MNPEVDKLVARLATFVAADMDYDVWCQMFGHAPGDTESIDEFQQLLDLYPQVWNALGSDRFFEAVSRLPQ